MNWSTLRVSIPQKKKLLEPAVQVACVHVRTVVCLHYAIAPRQTFELTPWKTKEVFWIQLEKDPFITRRKQISAQNRNKTGGIGTPLVRNPLDEKLGFHQLKRYERAMDWQAFAYDKIKDLCTVDMVADPVV